MAISVVGFGTFVGNANAVQAVFPAGVQAGDLAIWAIETANEPAGSSTFTGNTKSFVHGPNSPQQLGTAGGAGAVGLEIGHRVCDGSESSGSTWSIGDVGNHQSSRILVLRGVDTTTPIEASAGGTGSGNPVTWPTVTTLGPDRLILHIGVTPVDATSAGLNTVANAALSGVTILADDGTTAGNGGTLGWLSGTKAAAGATGATTAQVDSGANYAVITLALKPAVSTQTLTPGLFTNSQTIFAPTVTRGAVGLTAPLLSNSQTLYAPTVTRGAVTVAPGLLTNAQTFHAPAITAGLVTVAPPMLTNAQSFFTPAVTVGAVILTPPVIASGNEFYSPLVEAEGGPAVVAPPLIANDNGFFAATVTAGPVSIAPPLAANDNGLFAPTITVGAVALAPEVLVNESVFYAPSVVGVVPLVTPAERISPIRGSLLAGRTSHVQASLLARRTSAGGGSLLADRTGAAD